MVWLERWTQEVELWARQASLLKVQAAFCLSEPHPRPVEYKQAPKRDGIHTDMPYSMMGWMQNCLMASLWNADPDQRSVIHPASLWNAFFELCSLTLKLNVLVFCWKRNEVSLSSLSMKPSIHSPHRNMLLTRKDSDTTPKATKSGCGENHAHTNTQTHNPTHIFSLFVSGREKESEIDVRIKNKRNREALKRKKITTPMYEKITSLVSLFVHTQ